MHMLLAHIGDTAKYHSCCMHANASDHIVSAAVVATQCFGCAHGNTQPQRGIIACRIWSNSDNWAKRPGYDEADHGSDTDTNWKVLTI